MLALHMSDTTEDVELSRTIESLTARFDELLSERETLRLRVDEIERQISGLQQSLHGLQVYAKAKDPLRQGGIPELGKRLENWATAVDGANTLIESCRHVLRTNRGWMSAVDVRHSLQAMGFDFSRYTSNPLSSIHTTLKRLKASNEADDTAENGTTWYKGKIRREEASPTPARGRGGFEPILASASPPEIRETAVPPGRRASTAPPESRKK